MQHECLAVHKKRNQLIYSIQNNLRPVIVLHIVLIKKTSKLGNKLVSYMQKYNHHE